MGLMPRSEHRASVERLLDRINSAEEYGDQMYRRAKEMEARLEAVLTVLADCNGPMVGRRKIEDAIGFAPLDRGFATLGRRSA